MNVKTQLIEKILNICINILRVSLWNEFCRVSCKVDEKLVQIIIIMQYRGRYFQSSPVQSSPVQSSPVQSSPVQSSPVQSSPVQSSPVQSSPVQSSPVQSSSVQSSSVQSSSVQFSPVQLSSVQFGIYLFRIFNKIYILIKNKMQDYIYRWQQEYYRIS